MLMRRFSLCLSIIASILMACPAYSLAQQLVQEGGPFVCQGTGKLEKFSAAVNVTAQQESQPLWMTFYNGYGGRAGFSWIRVFLSPPNQRQGEIGEILADENAFTQKHAITVDVSGLLSKNGKQLFVEGEGSKGAIFSWALTTVKNKLTVLDCTKIQDGKDVLIHGTGFSVNANENNVTFDGKPAQVLQANARILVVKPPSGISSAGKMSLVVSALGETSEPIKVGVVSLPPHLTGMTPYGGPSGGYLTISGSNFAPAPSDNVVRIGPYTANVTSVNSNNLTCVIPDWGSSGGTLPVRVISNGVPSENTLSFWCMNHYYGGDAAAPVYQND
ncbi:IPT/TIG domain-containing protein [bacterium]|nr:IPT/TIG domain-containing protein [bacterium]QQR57315.1 MAG: IPT/TIG domain-containing protein [Candidatus Melainabacteria bacterium]